MEPFFKNWGFLGRVMSLIVITLLLSLIFLVLSMVLTSAIYGTDAITSFQVDAMQFMQSLLSVGIFIAPSLFFAFFFEDKNVLAALTLDRSPRILSIVICVSAMLASIPLISYLEDLNLRMTLPESLRGIEDWMRAKEADAKVATEKLLSCDGPKCIFSNIVALALVPALGEELFFRGTMQKNILQCSTRIPSWACVLITAFIFSAVHLQFFGFLPRFVLGAMLGFFLVYTRNIWCSIICHFVNNAMAVLAFEPDSAKVVEQEHLWVSSPYVIMTSAIAVVALMLLLIKTEKK